MKVFYASLALLTAIYRIVGACDVPHVSMIVQFTGRASLGAQKAVEFAVPLYTDCDYQYSGAPIATSANGPVPATAITASFAGNGVFVDQNGFNLDSNSLNTFLNFFGQTFDADTLLQLIICTAVGSDGTSYSFGPTEDFLFHGGAAIEVTSYQCTVSFGA